MNKQRELDAARTGRELARISVEDACALLSPSQWVQAVQSATLKAYERNRAHELLNSMGEG